MRYRNSKGFTLIEMLIVIAIIAILVAIIIPTIMHATTSAKAATDAANLRSVLGQANTVLAEHNYNDSVLADAKIEVGECKSFPDAEIELLYVNPGFIKIYYVDDGNYYGIDYFAAVSKHVENPTVYTEASLPSGRWYSLGDS